MIHAACLDQYVLKSAGTCAVGAYDQARLDALLGADGVEELTVYVAPVGRIGE